MPALSVSSLLSKHAVSKIDLLQIDAEGFDYEIIKMFDSSAVKPLIINFEHAHIPGPLRRECWQHLAKRGYSLAVASGMDTVAYLQRDRT